MRILKRLYMNCIQKLMIVVFAIGITFAEVNAQALEVSSNGYVRIGPNDLNDTTPSRYLTFGSNSRWRMAVDGNRLVIRQCSAFNNGELGIAITSTGDVGIGQWNPTEKLHVLGNIRAVNTIYTSDRRYKKDIKPISNLDNLFKINSVQYKASDEAFKEQLELFKKENQDMDEERYNSEVSNLERIIAEKNADQRTYFGIVAQELREIYPDLVYEDHQGYLAVNYIGLIPIMLDAIKELNAKVEKLEGKNKDVMPSTMGAVLYQNTPNPFDKHTEIRYFVPDDVSNASICVYDLTGLQLFRIDITSKGYSSVSLSANQFKAGMYLYSLIVNGNEVDTKKMVITD